MAKSNTLYSQQKNEYHESIAFAKAIETHSVIISGELGYLDIYKSIPQVLPDADLGLLAEKLTKAAQLFGLEWTKATWSFTSGSGDRPILYMAYQALTFHGDIDMERSIYYRDAMLIAEHDGLGIPRMLQGNDFSRMLNSILYNFYLSNNFKKILTKAGLDVGGYVWASAGFAATREGDVKKIIKDAYDNLHTFKSASRSLIEELEEDANEHYDSLDAHNPYPIYQWLTFDSREALEEVLKGSKWRGELNLEDSVQTFIFEKYVYKYKDLIP